ncbi:MAG: DUF58 domain-containing protein [Candidatus Omnitrophota bacterium]
MKILTERAKLLIIIFAVSLLFCWYTQFDFIYLISAILASILLLSFLFFCLTLTNVECERLMPDAAYEDERIKVSVTLKNRSIFTNYYIRLIDNFPADTVYSQEKRVLISHFARRSTINWIYEGLCFKRGVYWIGPFTIIGSDPLGLFRKYKVVNISSRLTVYPRIFNIYYLSPFMKGIMTPRYGPRTSRRSGEYEEFYGIREYRQEDGLRKIHWPSSAKHNELIVRHFEQSGVHAVSIVLDLKRENNLGFGKETTLEYAVKIAASLSKYFLDLGSIVQLLAFEDKPLMSSFGRDPSHFFTILELLAQVESNCSYSLEQVLTMLGAFIPPTSTLIVIRLDNDIEAAKASEQLIFHKNISIIEVQLISDTFDKALSKYPSYYIQAKSSDVQTYRILGGADLETSFSPVV